MILLFSAASLLACQLLSSNRFVVEKEGEREEEGDVLKFNSKHKTNLSNTLGIFRFYGLLGLRSIFSRGPRELSGLPTSNFF